MQLEGKIRHIVLYGLCLLLVGIVISGCDGQKAPTSALLRSISANPDTIDPHKAEGSWENIVIGDMFIGLFTDDENALPVPGSAKSWVVSDDGLTWTFKIRPMLWSDGEPVTAYDFEYAMRRLMDPKTVGAVYASLLYVLKNSQAIKEGKMPPNTLGARAIDASTLELQLEYPAPYLPGLLKHYVAWPVPKHAVEKYGDAWTKPENIVVNGPYRLTQWRTGDFLHSVKNELFHDADNVCFDEVYYYPYSDHEAVIRMARTGRLDLSNDFPGRRIEELRQILPGWPRTSNVLSITYLVFNSHKQPFDSGKVRQALAMIIDRDFIVREILKLGHPATAFVPPGIANYSKYLDRLPRTPYADMELAQRLDLARQLLQEAGYGPDRPLEFEMFYLSTGESPQIAPVIQANWLEIAEWVKPEIRRIDTRVLYNQLQEGDFTISMAAWIADYNDPQNFLYLLQSSTGGMNYGSYADPDFDAALETSNLERDMKKRAALLAQAENIILKDTPVAPISVRVSRNLVNPQLTGYVDNPEDIHRSRYLCRKTN